MNPYIASLLISCVLLFGMMSWHSTCQQLFARAMQDNDTVRCTKYNRLTLTSQIGVAACLLLVVGILFAFK